MWREIISTHIERDKMYQSKVYIQEFWYFVSGLDIQFAQSENKSPVCSCYLMSLGESITKGSGLHTRTLLQRMIVFI